MEGIHISTILYSLQTNVRSATGTRPCSALVSGGKEMTAMFGRTSDQTWGQINSYNVDFTHAHMPNMERVVVLASALAGRGKSD